VKFAINTPNFEKYSDPRLMADLAHEAEEAGWDGFFIWDHIGADWPPPIADPWILLAAMAMTTSRITLAPIVTPIPRRRPWKLARETVTLDHLSNGRLVLGVGTGSDSGREYSAYGESPDDKLHGEMLDEGLDVLTGLWSGEKFSYEGKHYQVKDVRYIPKPVQEPRIPIWVAGVWPHKKPFRRAARWDGVCPIGPGENGEMTPDNYRDMLAYIKEHRPSDGPFDVLVSGETTGTDHAADTAKVAPFAEVGGTWWQESFNWTHSIEQVRERIRNGPTKL
jgi:alkanesulfonate monooxygenase SsuD/methylene tetrahydromethanopterin reductase-like flavin-dependent oxidoreductase (luciferase family)